METLRSPAARRALDTLGYRVVGTGGGCAAYTRELRRESSAIVVAGDCVPPTRLRGEPIFVGFYDEDGVGPTLEFASLEAFLFAKSHQTAFAAWRAAGYDDVMAVVQGAAALDALMRHRAPLGLVAAAQAAVAADDIVQLRKHGQATWALGLFGPSLYGLDLSAYGFWAGPGAWVIVLEAR